MLYNTCTGSSLVLALSRDVDAQVYFFDLSETLLFPGVEGRLRDCAQVGMHWGYFGKLTHALQQACLCHVYAIYTAVHAQSQPA